MAEFLKAGSGQKCPKVSEPTKPETKLAPIEPPLGAYPAHVDEKGRLKMPVTFKEYLESMEDGRLFVTTTDKRIAKLYPISLWKENLKKLADLAIENPVLAKSMSITARHYGDDARLDAGGRVMLPTNLRRFLSLEAQEVWMDATPEGCINVYSKAEYESQLRKAEGLLEEANVAAMRKGFV
jgi:MraZ protein